MKQSLKAVVFVVLLLVFLAGLYFTLSGNHSLEMIFKGIPEANSALGKMVYLSGEVVRPGVYEVNESSTIIEVIDQAGGFTPSADINHVNTNLNLSKIPEDREKITIPSINQQDITTNSNLVNINTAAIDQLIELPGIGESTAKSIIENRPYTSIEELLDVKGIGESKYNAVKELVGI